MTKVLLAAAVLLAACGGPSKPSVYDASRDAAADVKEAAAQAKAVNKKVLVVVGGDWCSWCHALEKFWDSHKSLAAARDSKFVVVHVNTDGKTLPAPVSSWPAPAGFPHFYVLDGDANVLLSQNTGELEEGDSYGVVKMAMFLK
jgi:hypothetical protein